MCTTFVYRKNSVYIGMNFDNDGKECYISINNGNDFIVNSKINNRLFPSFGITKNKTFFNDIMVDTCDAGLYKRQNSKRWVTSTLIDEIIKSIIDVNNISEKLNDIEIVNNPKSSTHNLVVSKDGKTCLIEPGRGLRISSRDESDYFTLTNFPLTDYNETQPSTVLGSGCDRYLLVNELLANSGTFSETKGFDILKKAGQSGPVWKTLISLIFIPENNKLLFCLNNNFEIIYEYDFANEIIENIHNGKEYKITKVGININDIC